MNPDTPPVVIEGDTALLTMDHGQKFRVFTAGRRIYVVLEDGAEMQWEVTTGPTSLSASPFPRR